MMFVLFLIFFGGGGWPAIFFISTTPKLTEIAKIWEIFFIYNPPPLKFYIGGGGGSSAPFPPECTFNDEWGQINVLIATATRQNAGRSA